MNLVGIDYVNQNDKLLVQKFVDDYDVPKFILGINKLGKAVQEYVRVEGVIDDFTRVQSSRKKDVYSIEEVPKEAIILSVATGSPLEVKKYLDDNGYIHLNYLSLFRYSWLDLVEPPFMLDFRQDFLENEAQYQKTYDLLADEKSKEVFEKVINFKMSFDLKFMEGFTNNHEEQYFDKEILPELKNIRFVDGGGYVGDTVKEVIKNYPDFEKIYCIEPNDLHLKIAKRDFGDNENIEFVNCGLGAKKESNTTEQKDQNNCDHHYQAQNIDTIDNLINEPVDYIKLDIEGAEQDALDGAKETIKKYHPVLAVCVYHKAQDWYKVPQRILEIRDDYNIYLRHYMEGIYETVMYFIPKKS